MLFETGSFTEPGVHHCLDWLASETQELPAFTALSAEVTDVCPDFYVDADAGDQNPGPHAAQQARYPLSPFPGWPAVIYFEFEISMLKLRPVLCCWEVGLDESL